MILSGFQTHETGRWEGKRGKRINVKDDPVASGKAVLNPAPSQQQNTWQRIAVFFKLNPLRAGMVSDP